MHNGYLYPQDVKVVVSDKGREVVIDFSLPVVWDETALNLSKRCSLSGWELARRNYEKSRYEVWYKEFYPKYYAEGLAFRAHLANGGSVCSFHDIS